MGGKICVGIRHTLYGEPEEVFLFCHTNPLLRLVMTRDFLEQGETLRTFIENAKPENDWGVGQRIDRPQLPDDSYGFLLVDFVTRHMFSQNQYASFCEMLFGIRYATQGDTRLACVMDLLENNMLDEYVEVFSREDRTQIPLATFRAQLPEAIEMARRDAAAQAARLEEIFGMNVQDDEHFEKWTSEQMERLQQLVQACEVYSKEDLSVQHPLQALMLCVRLSPSVFVSDHFSQSPKSFKRAFAWACKQGWKSRFTRAKTKD